MCFERCWEYVLIVVAGMMVVVIDDVSGEEGRFLAEYPGKVRKTGASRTIGKG